MMNHHKYVSPPPYYRNKSYRYNRHHPTPVSAFLYRYTTLSTVPIGSSQGITPTAVGPSSRSAAGSRFEKKRRLSPPVVVVVVHKRTGPRCCCCTSGPSAPTDWWQGCRRRRRRRSWRGKRLERVRAKYGGGGWREWAGGRRACSGGPP